MEDTIVTIYCLCDDFLKAIHYRDDPQTRLSSAEVMSGPLVGAALFGGNIEEARSFLDEYGYMPNMVSKRRLGLPRIDGHSNIGSRRLSKDDRYRQME